MVGTRELVPERPLAAARRQGPWRRVGAFYILTTALAVAAWLPYGAHIAGVLSMNIPVAIPILGQYSPTIAAFVMVGWVGGFSGVGRFLTRSLNPLVDIRWFAVALAIPLVMAVALVVLHVAGGGVRASPFRPEGSVRQRGAVSPQPA